MTRTKFIKRRFHANRALYPTSFIHSRLMYKRYYILSSIFFHRSCLKEGGKRGGMRRKYERSKERRSEEG